MATSLNIKNTSQTHTVKIRMQNYDSKYSRWMDVKTDGIIPPGQNLDVWVQDKQRRVIIDELPT